jgi:hypothetical protein
MRRENLGDINPLLTKWFHRSLNFVKTDPFRPDRPVARFFIDLEVEVDAGDDVGYAMVEFCGEMNGGHVLYAFAVALPVEARAGGMGDKRHVFDEMRRRNVLLE